MTDSHVAWSRLALAVAALALLAPAARAQASLGLDVQVASRYRWRGITRGQTWVVQPALFGSTGEWCPALNGVCWGLSAGVWTNWQIGVVGADELSDLPPGRRGLSEWDGWAEINVRGELLDAAAGAVRYMYPSADVGGFRTPGDNTTELYARLHLPRVPWVKPSLVAWLDVDRVKGAFIEASGVGGLPLLPMVANLDLGAAAGYSLGQERNLASPSEDFNSAQRGFTYLEFTTGPSFNLAPIPRVQTLRGAIIVHLQVSLDDLTRRASRLPGITRDAFCWITFSGSLTWH